MESARKQPQNPRTRALYRDHNLQILFSITLVAVVGVSSIAPVLPKVAEALDISTNRVGLLITAFTLPGIVMTPILGILSDRIGRKKIIVPSLLLFGVAGASVAFATSFETMLGLRFLQGMGAASLGTINVTMIGDLYSGNERTEAMGYNSSVLSLGTGAYPAVGGALALFGWHYPFLLPLLAIPIGLLVLFSLNYEEPGNEREFKDYLVELMRSVRNRRVLGLLSVTLTTFVILFGAQVTYLPILIDSSFGASAAVIGLLLASASVASGLTSWQLGRITRRVSQKHLVLVAFGLYAIALTLVPLVPNLWMLVVPTIIFGVAQGINLPNVFSMLTNAVSAENRGALLALNGMLLRTGQAVGPLLMSVLAASLSVEGAFSVIAFLPLAMLPIVYFTIAS